EKKQTLIFAELAAKQEKPEIQYFPRNIDNWQGLMSPANLNTPVRTAISRYTCPGLQPRDNCITTYNHRREPKSRIHNSECRNGVCRDVRAVVIVCAEVVCAEMVYAEMVCMEMVCTEMVCAEMLCAEVVCVEMVREEML
ncbi:unnamed protein product, partial [Ranitomeya imitator]